MDENGVIKNGLIKEKVESNTNGRVKDLLTENIDFCSETAGKYCMHLLELEWKRYELALSTELLSITIDIILQQNQIMSVRNHLTFFIASTEALCW